MSNPETEGAPPRNPEITQLDFHQAMADFHTMFPNMDKDVIEAVLRANDGAVDATIDQLLTMAMDNEVEQCRKSLETCGNSPGSQPHFPVGLDQATGTQALDLLCFDGSPPPSYAQTMEAGAVARSPPQSSRLVTELGASSRGWRPPLLGPLPPDFLRIDLGKKQETILTTQILRERYADNAAQQEALRTNKREDPAQLALLEDERLALWFQNEEFVNQLKRDQDFMKSLESEESLHSNRSTASATSQQLPTHLQYVSHDDDAVFKEKLKHMGKVSKRKVATLARMFFKKKNGQQPILDEEDDDSSEVSPSPDIRRLR